MSQNSTPFVQNTNETKSHQKLKNIQIEEMRVVGMYMQEYAGQDRSTREITKLDDMIDTLMDLKKRIKNIDNSENLKEIKENGLESIERNLKLYLEEKEKIKEALNNSENQVTQADYEKDDKEIANDLGMSANRIIGKYMTSFSHKDRNNCDENELQNMINELQKIHDDMITMIKEKDHHDEFHLRNLIVVKRSLELYKIEHEKIIKTKVGELDDEDDDVVQTELEEDE